jgi:hypothetical protein
VEAGCGDTKDIDSLQVGDDLSRDFLDIIFVDGEIERVTQLAVLI